MPSQQLYASNISVNVGEALEARIKDPLWFLARQWQTGEFEAENGGSLAAAFITSRPSNPAPMRPFRRAGRPPCRSHAVA